MSEYHGAPRTAQTRTAAREQLIAARSEAIAAVLAEEQEVEIAEYCKRHKIPRREFLAAADALVADGFAEYFADGDEVRLGLTEAGLKELRGDA